MKAIATHHCFGGIIGYYEHESSVLNCSMRFTVFVPTNAKNATTLTYLSGLTCTEDNFTTKAGAYGVAAELGLIIVAPDTSPRGEEVADEEGWDIGKGAGFYVDATEAPWNRHYRMYRYVTEELYQLILAEFPSDPSRQGIFGHSMGGHGALTIGLKHPEQYRSISAFSPIVAPMQCPWGEKAFTTYLGTDKESWREYDACELIKQRGENHVAKILVDQGEADPFLTEQLKPELLEQACQATGQPLNLRRHAGYDHGYFFIQTMMEDHLRHHAKYCHS